MVRVMLNDPHMQEEQGLLLPGLGVFLNRRDREISRDEIERYERKTRRSFTRTIESHPYLHFVEDVAEESSVGPVVETVGEETPSPRRRGRGERG